MYLYIYLPREMKPGTRITLNTLVTYGRSVVSLLFGLFSSRWILAALGQDDYGLYGVVGSVIVAVTFLNIVLSNSVVRFYAVSIGQAGKDADPKANNAALTGWFNAALLFHGALAVLILIVGWPAGEWFVRKVLVIPPARMAAGIWALRAGILSAVLAVASVPFTAMFTAWQRFGELSCFEVARSAAMAVIAYWLLNAAGDRLVVFSCAVAIMAGVLTVAQIARAICRFQACRISRLELFVPSRTRELMVYAGYRVLGIFGWLAQKQGGAFIVNLSFGVRANAAYSIAGQFAMHASSLTAALSSALTPALATANGRQDKAAFIALTLKSCKFSGLLAALCAVPLVCEVENVLRLWLWAPPPGAASLALMLTVAMVLDAATAGIVAALSAELRIGAWQAFECVVLAMTCPVAWGCFWQGLPLEAWGWVFLAATVAMTVGRVWFAHRMLALSPGEWCSHVALPLAVVFVGAEGVAMVVRWGMAPSFVRLVAVGLGSVIATLALAWAVAIDGDERRRVLEMLRIRKGVQG